MLDSSNLTVQIRKIYHIGFFNLLKNKDYKTALDRFLKEKIFFNLNIERDIDFTLVSDFIEYVKFINTVVAGKELDDILKKHLKNTNFKNLNLKDRSIESIRELVVITTAEFYCTQLQRKKHFLVFLTEHLASKSNCIDSYNILKTIYNSSSIYDKYEIDLNFKFSEKRVISHICHIIDKNPILISDFVNTLRIHVTNEIADSRFIDAYAFRKNISHKLTHYIQNSILHSIKYFNPQPLAFEHIPKALIENNFNNFVYYLANTAIKYNKTNLFIEFCKKFNLNIEDKFLAILQNDPLPGLSIDKQNVEYELSFPDAHFSCYNKEHYDSMNFLYDAIQIRHINYSDAFDKKWLKRVVVEVNHVDSSTLPNLIIMSKFDKFILLENLYNCARLDPDNLMHFTQSIIEYFEDEPKQLIYKEIVNFIKIINNHLSCNQLLGILKFDDDKSAKEFLENEIRSAPCDIILHLTYNILNNHPKLKDFNSISTFILKCSIEYGMEYDLKYTYEIGIKLLSLQKKETINEDHLVFDLFRHAGTYKFNHELFDIYDFTYKAFKNIYRSLRYFFKEGLNKDPEYDFINMVNLKLKKKNIILLTEAPHGTLGDVSAAGKLISLLEHNFNITWFIVEPNKMIKAKGILNEEFDYVIEDSWDTFFEYYKEEFEMADAIIPFPTYHYLKKEHVQELLSMPGLYLPIPEYNLISHSDYEIKLKTGLGDSLGIFIKDEIEKYKGTDKTMELVSQREYDQIYFGYLNKNREKNVNIITDDFVTFSFILHAISNKYKCIKIVINTTFIPEMIEHLKGKFKTYLKNENPDLLAHFDEMTIDYSNPFPLDTNEFQFFMQKSKLISVTGDQSFSEAIANEKLFFYQIMSWKIDLFNNYIKLIINSVGVESKLLYFYLYQSLAKDSNQSLFRLNKFPEIFETVKANSAKYCINGLLNDNFKEMEMELKIVKRDILTSYNLSKNLPIKIKELVDEHQDKHQKNNVLFFNKNKGIMIEI